VDNSKFEHIQYDAISYSGMREANLESFGKRVIPDYDFSKAKTVVSVGAGFMNSWVLPTQFLGDYLVNRNPDNDWMSRLFSFESNMSMTGSNADIRSMIKPSEQAKVLALLLKEVGGNISLDYSSLEADVIANVKMAAAELKASKYLIEDDSIRFDIEKTESWDNQHIKISNDTLYLTHPNMVYGDVYTFTATRTTFDDNDILSLETDGINHRHLEYTWNIIQNNKPWIDSLDIKPPSTIRFSKDSIFVDDSPYLLSIDHKRLSILGQEFILLLEDEETVSLHPTKHLAKRWFLIYRRQGLGY